MPVTNTKTVQLNLKLTKEMKRRLRFYADTRSKQAGHFVSMQACLVELVNTHVPPPPGELDSFGKKGIRKALKATG